MINQAPFESNYYLHTHRSNHTNANFELDCGGLTVCIGLSQHKKERKKQLDLTKKKKKKFSLPLPGCQTNSISDAHLWLHTSHLFRFFRDSQFTTGIGKLELKSDRNDQLPSSPQRQTLATHSAAMTQHQTLASHQSGQKGGGGGVTSFKALRENSTSARNRCGGGPQCVLQSGTAPASSIPNVTL